MTEPEKPNLPVEAKGPQQDARKTSFDEIIEGVEKISTDDLTNNPSTAINLIVVMLKERSVLNRELSNKVEKILFENKELSNKLSVANERLKSKETFGWIINFVTALGAVLLTLASTGNFKIGEWELNWVLFVVGLLLAFTGVLAFIVEVIRNSSGGVKES